MPSRILFTGQFKQIVELNQDETRHLKALRLKSGDKIELFDGKGNIALGTVEIVRKKAKVKVSKIERSSPELPEIILWTAIPKGERADWLVEKAVELGVSKIVPIIFRYSVVKPKKTKVDRWKRLAVAASAQCKRAFVPEILEPITFKQALKSVKDEQLILCHQDGKSIKDLKLNKKKIILIIGPEGGFDKTELEIKADKLKLSNNILRTETAAVVSVGLIENF